MRTLEAIGLAAAAAAIAFVLLVAAPDTGERGPLVSEAVEQAPAAPPPSRPEPAAEPPDQPAPAPRLRVSANAPADFPVVRVKADEEVVLHDEPAGQPVTTAKDETEFGSPSVFSVIRQQDRWIGVPSPDLPNGELGWIKVDSRRLLGGTVDLEIRVDLSDRRTELLRDGELMREFPVTIGAPDSPTPTGRFAVTDTFRGGLNPVYGCCAVALTATQPHLPADWPGGDRIAIHGNGTGEPLGESASNGCVRAADRNVSYLVDHVPPGTPVVIRE